MWFASTFEYEGFLAWVRIPHVAPIMQILDGEDALYRAAYTSFPRWFESTGLHQVYVLETALIASGRIG